MCIRDRVVVAVPVACSADRVVAAAAYLGMRRGALSRVGQGITAGARRIATIGTAREEKQALAYLLVLTGRGNLIGQNVPLYNEITTCLLYTSRCV